LTIVGKKSPELATQLETERAAGLFAVDLININQPGLALFWKNKGYYEPYKVAAFDLLRPDYADEAGAFYTSGIYLLPCAYNTRAFPNSQGLPDSLQDFLDPKWRGKLVLAHPRTAGNVRTFFLGHLRSGKIDWAWIEGLARQDVLFVRGHVDAIRIIASGERIITLTTSTFNVLAARGNRQAIDIHPLKEGTILAEQHVGILDRAPHPNSARLLLELLTSREGQEAIAAGGQYWPVIADARPSADLPRLADLNPIRVDAPAGTESVEREFIQRFDQVFGRG
jgi:iron(III) transport system substrate-binding protein